jgi:hypothetical protein
MVAAVVSLAAEMYSEVMDLNLHIEEGFGMEIMEHFITILFLFNEVWQILNGCQHSFLNFFVQGPSQGWYDGTAILFAVFLVIVTTG